MGVTVKDLGMKVNGVKTFMKPKTVVNKQTNIEKKKVGRIDRPSIPAKPNVRPVVRPSIKKNLKVIDETDKVILSKDRSVSIIIPYMHNPERFVLLKKCIEKLPDVSIYTNLEICIHEIGTDRGLDSDFVKNFNYKFTKYDGLFNRGWALNVGVRELSTGESLVLMDSDLIVNNDWINEVFTCEYPITSAWGVLPFLNEKSTKEYIKSGKIEERKYVKKRVPNIFGAAGGATFVKRDVFYKMCGMFEVEGWGFEDNVTLSKFYYMGYPPKRFGSKIHHLFHSHRTVQTKDLKPRSRKFLAWKRNDWKKHIKETVDNWGKSDGSNIHKKSISVIQKTYTKIPSATGSPKPEHTREINRLCNMWDGFDRDALEVVYSTKEPLITVVMLSYIRYEKLKRTLNYLHSVTKTPINISLRVQGARRLNKIGRKQITDIVDKFPNGHVSFTEHNHGSGKPRWEALHKALEFNTPFILFGDDDTTHQKGGIEALASLLISKKPLGAVASWCSPGYMSYNVVNNFLQASQPKPPFEYVDASGSATTMMRSEIFEKCDYDWENYFVGWGDTDLSMQIKREGWLWAILALNELKAVNDISNDPVEYSEVRYNPERAKVSAQNFFKKWGIKIYR